MAGNSSDSEKNPVTEAINRIGLIELAKKLKPYRLSTQEHLTYPALRKWEAAWARGKFPAERVPEFARVTGVSKHRLRPDLWRKGE